MSPYTANGIVQASLEYITEHMPTSKFFEAIDNPATAKELVGNILKSMGLDGFGELVNALAGNAAELTILGDHSAFTKNLNAAVQVYTFNGMDEETAREKALKETFVDFFILQPLTAGMEGALSAGIMQGLANTVGMVKQKFSGKSEQQKTVDDMLSPLEKKGRIDYLSDDDFESYAKTGNQHAQHRKAELINKGIKPIMTSKKDVDTFIEQSLDGKLDSQIRAFSKATERMVKDIKDETGGAVNVDGYYLELNSDDVFHLREHTEEKKSGQKDFSRNEIKNIPLYMTSYDDVIDVHVQKDGRMTITVGKKINGHSVLVSIVSSGRKSLILKTAYVLSTEKYEMVVNSKKSAKSQETTISQGETMPNTSDNVPTITLFKDIVSQRSSIVNIDSSPKSDNAPAGVEDFDVQKKDVNPELQKMLDDHNVVQSDGDVQRANPELQKSIADHEAVFEKKAEQEQTAQDDVRARGIVQYTSEEAKRIIRFRDTYNNYVNGINMTLKEFFNRHSRKNVGKFEKLYMGKISSALARKVNSALQENGVQSDVSNYDFVVTNDMLDHTENEHGEKSKETAEKVNDENIGCIEEVMNNPDKINFGGFNEQGNPKIVFSKQIDGANAIYVQFVSDKYSRLTSVSFYFDRKIKKGTTTANNTLESPALYVRNDGGQVPSDVIIAEGQYNVNAESPTQFESGDGKIKSAFKPSDAEINEILQDEDVLPDNTLSPAEARALNGRKYYSGTAPALAFDRYAGGNQKLRDSMRNKLEVPLANGQMQHAVRSLNKRNEIINMCDKTGVTKGGKESAAAQHYGEGFYTDKHGEQHAYTEADLKRDFPENWKNIKEFSEYCKMCI